jgi:hypothetical protein
MRRADAFFSLLSSYSAEHFSTILSDLLPRDERWQYLVSRGFCAFAAHFPDWVHPISLKSGATNRSCFLRRERRIKTSCHVANVRDIAKLPRAPVPWLSLQSLRISVALLIIAQQR